MGVLAFRVDNLSNWEKENPLLEDGEMAIVRDAKQYRIGDGFHKFKELESFGHGMTAYEIAVLHGHFRGSIEDFASQFNQFNRYGEQQCGKFTNDGPGWNAFHFPEEFGEDVYITATAENKDAFVSIKNITKIGFHYCVYTSSGNTTAENVAINYIAVAVSNKNLAHSIAQTAGLNPFDFDNLEMLFTSNANEIVENEQAFGIIKRSSMASAKYICVLTNLDIYNYHNVASMAADSTAMNIIAASSAARGFVGSSKAAYDAIRLSDMAIAKYAMGIIGQTPDAFESMENIIQNENALTCLVNDATAMAAVADSATAMAAIRREQMALDTILNNSIAMVEVAKVENAISSFFDDENALICLVSSATAMAAVADSATAMAAIRGHQEALDQVLNSSLAMTEVVKVSSAVSSFFNDTNALHCLVINATAMAAVAGSATAMAAIMKNSEAREKFFGSSHSVGRGLATYANINNSTLIGLQSLSAVAASDVAMSAVAASPVAMAAILKSNTARTNTAVLTSLSGKYDVLISTLNNSSYFTVSLNKTLTDTSNTKGKTITITSTNGIALLSTYKMNNYGGSDDTEGTIKHKTAAVISKTWRLGTGNNTTTLNAVGVGGMDITATGTYTGKITYGTYTYNEYIAK